MNTQDATVEVGGIRCSAELTPGPGQRLQLGDRNDRMWWEPGVVEVGVYDGELISIGEWLEHALASDLEQLSSDDMAEVLIASEYEIDHGEIQLRPALAARLVGIAERSNAWNYVGERLADCWR